MARAMAIVAIARDPSAGKPLAALDSSLVVQYR